MLVPRDEAAARHGISTDNVAESNILEHQKPRMCTGCSCCSWFEALTYLDISKFITLHNLYCLWPQALKVLFRLSSCFLRLHGHIKKKYFQGRKLVRAGRSGYLVTPCGNPVLGLNIHLTISSSQRVAEDAYKGVSRRSRSVGG